MAKSFLVALLVVAELFSSSYPTNAASATFYHPSLAGRTKANGQPYRPGNMTAASNNYRLGTMLKVTNKRNNKSVIVKVTDRCGNCSIDLSLAAFKAIAKTSQGRVPVKVQVLR